MTPEQTLEKKALEYIKSIKGTCEDNDLFSCYINAYNKAIEDIKPKSKLLIPITHTSKAQNVKIHMKQFGYYNVTDYSRMKNISKQFISKLAKEKRIDSIFAYKRVWIKDNGKNHLTYLPKNQ